jgi:hypothetical protein
MGVWSWYVNEDGTNGRLRQCLCTANDLFQLIATLIVILLFAGCSPYKYKVTNKRAQIVKNSYSSADTIVFQNFIFCSNINTLFHNEALNINEDSLLNIFFTSVENSGIQFVYNDEGRNFCDEEFQSNKLIKAKKIDKRKIFDISESNSTLSAVPFVYINNRALSNRYFTSKGIPGGGGYLRDTFLNMTIYLVKNDEIVYHKSAWFGPVSSETATYNEDSPKKLEQEHWDNLVRLVMLDYINRVQ